MNAYPCALLSFSLGSLLYLLLLSLTSALNGMVSKLFRLMQIGADALRLDFVSGNSEMLINVNFLPRDCGPIVFCWNVSNSDEFYALYANGMCGLEKCQSTQQTKSDLVNKLNQVQPDVREELIWLPFRQAQRIFCGDRINTLFG